MSLWWVSKDQLDRYQMTLIDELPLHDTFLVLGPPGSGKTNVLLRRAQFVRGQDMPNVLVLTFTRALTEFLRTGCMDTHDREIFPRTRVTTIESWLRSLYSRHKCELPKRPDDLTEWKRRLAHGALHFIDAGKLPRYDSLFIDEAQDLVQEEVDLLAKWSDALFLVGDDRQQIFAGAEGLQAVRQVVPSDNERTLPFHYRVAPEICRVADRILLPQTGDGLAATCHYNGPQPATVMMQPNAQSRLDQMNTVAQRLSDSASRCACMQTSSNRATVLV